MHPEPLVVCFAKIERAKTQIAHLEAALQIWAQTNPYHITEKANPNDPQEIIWSFKLHAPPPDISVQTGETLHNIRSPLDQMLTALSAEHGGPTSDIAFPFGRDKDAFETALGKVKKLMPTKVADDVGGLIAGLEPYKGGNNELLFSLSQLNRSDKHRPGLIPFGHLAGWKVGNIAIETGGALLIMGNPAKQHLVTDGYVPSPRPECPPDEVEFLTTRPGTKFHTDAHPTFHVAFRDMLGVDAPQNIIRVLNELRDLVERVLLTFEGRFFR